MSIDGIRRGLQAAKLDGKVDTNEVDNLLLSVRDGKGLDSAERVELLKAADGFDDASKQRVLKHISSIGQKNAWVNVTSTSPVVAIEGRYAKMSLSVPGLSARLGLFDNCFGLEGKAAANGTLKLNIEGKSISVIVTRGETAGSILAKVKAQLPTNVTGVSLSGTVAPFDPALFTGKSTALSDTAAHLMLYKPAELGLKPGEKPLRVVVTGYGAFMGITDNPSANMAQKLSEMGIKGAIVDYRRLDVTTDAVDAFMNEVKRLPPDVILSMGVTHGQAQVEERPENHLGANNDGNDKPMKERSIISGGVPEQKTDLPVDVIDWSLQQFGDKRVVGTSKSDPNYQPDRSAYLCNYLGYNLASAFNTNAATTAGFMHISPTTPVEQMHEVLKAVVARQLDVSRNTPVS
jgi:pyrrolidone-carboxylate peptidase